MWTIVFIVFVVVLVVLALIGLIGARRDRRRRRAYLHWDGEVAKHYKFAVWCRMNGQLDLSRSTHEYVARLATLRDLEDDERDLTSND